MGNVFPPQAPVCTLELRLSRLNIELPRGRRGQPCELVARVCVAERRPTAKEAPWEEVVSIQLNSKQSAVLISLFSAETVTNGTSEVEERFLTEVCLPYSGPGGLAELGLSAGGPPLPLQLALAPGAQCNGATQEELSEAFRQAREGVRPDRPCLAVMVRELAEPTQRALSVEDSSWTLPPARRQVIALELQNAALQHQKHKLLPEGPDPPVEESSAMPSHVRQLQMIQQENEQIRVEIAGMRQKLERTKAILTNSATQAQQNASPVPLNWAKTLQVMQQELGHCQERQQKIRANYEERVAGLKSQIQQAQQAKAEAHMDVTFNPQSELLKIEEEAALERITAMEAHIKDATLRRDDLLWQWNEAQRKATEGKGQAEAAQEAQRLRAQAQENEVELEGLRQELASRCEREQGIGNEQDLQRTISQLYEDMDELQRAREDERVRSESEVRELKTERDTLRDRLDDAASELQRLRSQTDALKAMRAQAERDSEPSVAQLNSLRAENASKAQELERLRQCEEDRKIAIAALEQEQEALVEQISLKAARQAPPVDEGNSEGYVTALKDKVTELEGSLVQARASCEEKQAELEKLRRLAEDAKATNQALLQSYNSLRASAFGARQDPTDAVGHSRGASGALDPNVNADLTDLDRSYVLRGRQDESFAPAPVVPSTAPALLPEPRPSVMPFESPLD